MMEKQERGQINLSFAPTSSATKIKWL